MHQSPVEPNVSEQELQDTSICEMLDRVLNKGVVITGEAVISVADVDLLYLGLQVTLTSVQTAREQAIAHGHGSARDSAAENRRDDDG